MTSHASRPVRRRKVFYIPGYDPFPPRRYRELYRKESAVQAAISGYDIALKPGAPGGGYRWQVAARIDGLPALTDVEVLVWSDIVRDSRPNSVLRTYRDLLRTAWIYISTGALFRLMRLRKGPVIAALYPVFLLLAQAGLALGLGWAMVRIVQRMGMEISGDTSALVSLGAAPMGVAVAGLTLRWFRENDARFFAYYLMHDFAFSAAQRGAYPPELEARLHSFTARISDALQEDIDEVLVVGHSSGAYLGVSALADLLRGRDLSDHRPVLGFLSLGQVVPMVSFLPQAQRLRRDLRHVSQRADLTWVDVTAPGDGCSFALCDPVGVSGQATPDRHGPLVFSAAFTQSLSPARWKSLRWRFFRLHFQYLCAFDRPKDYDYFQITAGPQTLKARYADRVPSKSRMDASVTGFHSVET